MTLTSMIEDELLDVVGEPGGLEQVMRRHRGSKGPLYKALSSATDEMVRRLELANLEKTAAEARSQDLEESIDPLQERRDRLVEEVQELEDRQTGAETRLTAVEGVLARVQELRSRGFGEEELDKLGDFLAQVAAAQGAPPEEGVAQFFQTVQRYEQVVSLALEEKRAEARVSIATAKADKWEAEAQRRQARSKARSSAIELAEKLLAQGVKPDDPAHWAAVLEKAGVTVEALAKSLELYGSIEMLIQACQERADELQIAVSKLEIQVTTLNRERDNLSAAIQAVQEKGLRQIKKAGAQVTRNVDSLVSEAIDVGRLRAEAAGLGELIETARLLRSGDYDNWKRMPREIMQHFLVVVLSWVQVEGRNPQVTPPESVGKANYLLKYTPVRLSLLLHWALGGLMQEESKSLTQR